MTAFTWQNEIWWLHPLRGLFREKNKTLILSDVHLGKTGHFRKEGIAVPQQIYREDLNRFFTLIQTFNPKSVIITGDLFHSRFNLEWEWFGQYRKQFAQIPFHLVLGNHDKLNQSIAVQLGLSLTQLLDDEGITFLHNYNDKPEHHPYPVIYGHLHPAIQVKTGVRQSVRLPCFVFSQQACIMPAFSLFTGNMTIKPSKQQRVFVITENKIIPL